MLSASCNELTRLSIRLALDTAHRDDASKHTSNSADLSVANARVKAAVAELSEHQKYCPKCLGRWVEYVDLELLAAS